MITPTNFILPAYWASYLINNDSSSLTKEDKLAADKFLMDNDLPFPSSCSDEHWYCNFNDADTLPCDVLEYTFLID